MLNRISVYVCTVILFVLTPRVVWAENTAVSSQLEVPEGEKVDLWVLAVGVEDYPDPEIPSLQFSEDDAETIVWWGKTQEGHLYKQVHTTLLTGTRATRAHIIEAAQAISRQARVTDQIVLFLAGHGMKEVQSGRYFYFTYDTRLSSVASSALGEQDIEAYFRPRGQDPNRLVVWVDTCQSGPIVKVAGARGLVSGRTQEELEQSSLSQRSPDPDGNPRVKLKIAASTVSQSAGEGPGQCVDGEPETSKGHGHFTCALLRVLTSPDVARDHHPNVVNHSDLRHHIGKAGSLNSDWLQQPLSTLYDDSPGGQYLGLGWIPNSVEWCDTMDNDLDGEVDEGFPDSDQDGTLDCLEKEQCNGLDEDLDGEVDEGYDQDGDGYWPQGICTGHLHYDCNDSDVNTHPGVEDLDTLGLVQCEWDKTRQCPSAVDNDCDGAFDEDAPLTRSGLSPTLDSEYRYKWQRVAFTVAVPTTTLVASAVAMYQLHNMVPPSEPITREMENQFLTWGGLTLAGGMCTAAGIYLSLDDVKSLQVLYQERVHPTREVTKGGGKAP